MAACAGGDHLTCATAISQGDLIRPYAGEIQSDKSYVITPGAGGHTASSTAFETWVREQIDGAYLPSNATGASGART